MHPDWARGIRDQCVGAGVPFTFKQWGEWLPASQYVRTDLEHGYYDIPKSKMRVLGSETTYRVGKKAAGRELDGQVWDQWPWEAL